MRTRGGHHGQPLLALLLAMVPPGLAACGGGGGSGWQGTVEDSAGVAVVTNAGVGAWSEGEGWTVETDLVIGTAAGEPEYQFGQIAGIDIDSEGRVYILDQQASEVRVFSPDGEFLHAMGQRGAGPGELSQGAGPVLVGPGDTVRVPDMLHQRITLYTPDGEAAGSHPLPMTDGIAARWMEGPDDDLVQQAMIMQMPGQQEVEQKNLILRRDRTGAVVDTLLEMPIGEQVSFTGGQPTIRLFEAEPAWAIAPDGRLYSGINTEYSIRQHGPEGDLHRIVRKASEPRPVTESDQDQFLRTMQELWRDQGMPAQAVEMMSQAIEFADVYPAYNTLMAGPDGTLWVQHVQTPDDLAAQGAAFDIQDMGAATWEVFDAEGRYLGVVEMPERFTPTRFHGERLWGLLRDELDVQYAARLRLERDRDEE